ncbi:031e403b-91d2-4aff-b62d-429b6b613310 [Sclerotinia trifoliorum]|uniref:031e403b-91d2-4aff-b62d-429b6b613310 n=1 Tax=Sclerotinia trifoliorum TaxID=28548 RepID=A0A8H2ZL69_9HELO|nr:031e403b-91d2-4aff-b62d-429b6b613310 [Sclerotinia trifoliorum]
METLSELFGKLKMLDPAKDGQQHAEDACMRAVHLNMLTMAGQPGAPSVLSASQWEFHHAIMQGKDLVVARPYRSWVMESVSFNLLDEWSI